MSISQAGIFDLHVRNVPVMFYASSLPKVEGKGTMNLMKLSSRPIRIRRCSN